MITIKIFRFKTTVKNDRFNYSFAKVGISPRLATFSD